MKLRLDLLAPLCCSVFILASPDASFAVDDEPYDPTSPEHVAEREDEGDVDVDEGEGVLSGPTVEAQPSGRSGRGGGGAGAGAMGQMNALSIFSTKCQQCHGSQKQKGGVQLLPMDMIFSGSEEYWYVQKGDPESSELMRRITLPSGHDDAMPPDGKSLTKAEVEVITEWIRTGAPTDLQAPPARKRKINPRQWTQAFLQLELTEEQRTSAESQLTSYQSLNAEFDRAHQERIRTLQQEIRASRDTNDTIANASAKQELDRLQAEQPKFDMVQEELWTMLTPQQQEALKDALATATSAAQPGMRGEGSRGRPGAGRPGRRGGSNSALTEEERARLRELMQERRRNGQGRSPRGPGRGGGGDDGDGD